MSHVPYIQNPIHLGLLVAHLIDTRQFGVSIASDLPQLIILDDTCLGDVSHQTIIAFPVLSMALANYEEAIPQNEFIICSGKEGRWDVDENCNWGITHVCECLSPIEYQSDESGPEISRKVCGDSVASEAPDHITVGETYDEWCRSWGDKRL